MRGEGRDGDVGKMGWRKKRGVGAGVRVGEKERGYWGTYAAAGELGELVFVETAGRGGVEREVGEGGGQECEEEGEGGWDHGGGIVGRNALVLGVVAVESGE